jgi:acetoin utilization protein AcuB
MLVKDCMTRHPIMIAPEIPATEAQHIMAENKVRHVPVVGDGKRLLGLITRQRLALKPDTLASLDVWEISRYLTNLNVQQLMVKAENVHTIGPDRTVERAARMLADHKIGALPVLEDDDVVIGMLSEVDLLRSFQEMLGLPTDGVRVTIRMPDVRDPNQPSEFAKLMAVVAEKGWGVMGVGTFPSPRKPGHYDAVLKIPNASIAEVRDALSKIPGQEIIDAREVV